MKTMRSQFDDIYSSMVNGQRRQAVDQIYEMGLAEMPDLLDYFYTELNQPEMVLDVCKSYFRITSR